MRDSERHAVYPHRGREVSDGIEAGLCVGRLSRERQARESQSTGQKFHSLVFLREVREAPGRLAGVGLVAKPEDGFHEWCVGSDENWPSPAVNIAERV